MRKAFRRRASEEQRAKVDRKELALPDVIPQVPFRFPLERTRSPSNHPCEIRPALRRTGRQPRAMCGQRPMCFFAVRGARK